MICRGEGGNPIEGGQQHIIWPLYAADCMKMRKNGRTPLPRNLLTTVIFSAKILPCPSVHKSHLFLAVRNVVAAR